MINFISGPDGIYILISIVAGAIAAYVFNQAFREKKVEVESPNPFLKWPRNEPCPCRSGRKFKSCCLKTMPRSVPYSQAMRIQKQLKESGMIK